MRKFFVGLTLVLLTGFAVTALVCGETKERKNRLFVAECAPPERNATETITFVLYGPDGNSNYYYHVPVPLTKGCSSEDKAEAIRCAVNEHESLQGKMKVGTNAMDPAIVQIQGENGYTIKAGGGDNKSRQEWIAFHGIGRKAAPIITGVLDPEFAIKITVGPSMSGYDPDGELAHLRFGVLGCDATEHCLNTGDFANPMCLLDDLELLLEAGGIGEVFREDPYTLYLYLFAGQGNGVLVGCDDNLMDLDWEFGEWDEADGRKWE